MQGDPLQAAEADGEARADGAGESVALSDSVTLEAGGDAQGAEQAVATTSEWETLLASDESFEKLREHPRVQALLQERENAGAQRREAQMRREAGNRENTRAQVQRFLSEVGVDATSLQGPQGDRLNFMYDLAQTHAAGQIAHAYAEYLLSEHLPAERVQEAVQHMQAGRTSDYVNALRAGDREVYLAQVALKDIPQGSTLRSDVEQEVQRRVRAELQARNISSNGIPAPNPSGGQPAGSGRGEPIDKSSLLGISRAVARGQMSEEEGRRALGEITR